MSGFNPLDHPISFSRPLRLQHSAWIEHIPFGMLLIDMYRPDILVELGTHTGASYCAFCQSVKALNLPTRCYAIDTWQGDPHAGFYGEDILSDLRTHHDPLYGEFSTLIQSTFDDAIHYFSNKSIDLLHIDGCHTYEAVKHDFERWLPKLSERGVVLFHDTNVRERDFGVWKLWEELKGKYPHFEFFHGYGLGLLCIGDKSYDQLKTIIDSSDEQAQTIREFFFNLGSRLSFEMGQSHQITTLSQQVAERDQKIQNLMVEVADRDRLIKEKDEALESIMKSKSWKITEPLRSVTTSAQKIRQRLFR